MNFSKIFLIRFITVKYNEFKILFINKFDSYYENNYLKYYDNNYNDKNDCNRWVYQEAII